MSTGIAAASGSTPTTDGSTAVSAMASDDASALRGPPSGATRPNANNAASRQTCTIAEPANPNNQLAGTTLAHLKRG